MTIARKAGRLLLPYCVGVIVAGFLYWYLPGSFEGGAYALLTRVGASMIVGFSALFCLVALRTLCFRLRRTARDQT